MDRFTLRQLGLAVALSTSMGMAWAATSNDFVDNAAAGGIAEIETSKLALEKKPIGGHQGVRQQDDHRPHQGQRRAESPGAKT